MKMQKIFWKKILFPRTQEVFWKSPVHEGAFRLVYKDYNSSFNDLLVKDNASRNHRSLQEKAFEIFKLRLSIALEVVKDNF